VRRFVAENQALLIGRLRYLPRGTGKGLYHFCHIDQSRDVVNSRSNMSQNMPYTAPLESRGLEMKN
jgi:hypothetical protein